MNPTNPLNLNSYLQPINSPIDQYQTPTNSYDFFSQNERDSISNSRVSFITADKVAAGTVIVPINLGSSSGAYLLLDGANNRIIVNDGTTNRVVIGSV